NINISLPTVTHTEGHVWHLFVIQTTYREELQRYLSSYGIQTLIHYPLPPHKQQAYNHLNNLVLPITENMHERVLSLPMDPNMSKNDIDKVIKVVNSFRV
ncbi:TPA: DegT/DnrJ/EryC1/StrS family aminotransferase, partial [Salmonella enterica]|nr:DegT/DnrJ/EryC1/StrS family aminotransferase [Salmonella enterica]